MAALAIEPLSRQEFALDRAAKVLRLGVIAGVIVAVMGFIGAVVISAQTSAVPGGQASGLAGLLRSALLLSYAGGDDAAVSIIMLAGLANVAAFLVTLVGMRAREIWALPLPWLVVLGNLLLMISIGFTPGAIFILIAAFAGYTAARILRIFRINPVALKELRGRMRGARAFVVLSIYLLLMSGFALLMYLVFSAGSGIGSSVAGEIGRSLFITVVGIELLLILFIAPSLTSGAITGERERQTFDLLRTTLLNAPTFVMGKLESALAYLLLLLLAAIPLQSLAFLFGGVSEGEILLAFVILVVTALALGAVGIYFSTAVERTITANLRAYLLVLAVMFIIPVIAGVVLDVLGRMFFTAGGAFNSPLLETIFAYASALLIAINPIATALSTQQILIERETIGFYPYTLASNGGTIPMVSPWLLFTLIYLIFAAVLILLAIRRARQSEAEDE